MMEASSASLMVRRASRGADHMELCHIGGRFVRVDEACIPVSDLIVQRGVGAFEAISTHGGRPLMLTPHLERLIESAARSRIRVPLSVDEMKAIVREGIARVRGEGDDEVLARPYLTGGDVFDPREGFTRSRFFVLFDRIDPQDPELFERGVTLDPVPFGRDDPSVKSVDYRATYSSLREDSQDVLYCPDGEITEAGHSTFFLVLGGQLLTAPLSRVLKGTTRGAIIELARGDGVEVEERCPLWPELSEASEAFVTGSVKKVVPVTRIGSITIGDGRPGPITRRLLELYLRHIEAWLE